MMDNLLELIRKYDRPGPRYTSYPPATEFSARYGAARYAADLRRADREAAKPFSLYVHIPFCEARCSFCACNVVAARNREIAGSYLLALDKEIELVAAQLPNRRAAAQLHFGGGTPTYLAPGQLEALFRSVASRFRILGDAELAIEADPCVTTRAHLETLRGLGFNRLSMGVQDLAPDVQQAIGRGQTIEETERLFRWARELGFHSINIDLIYGLPAQRLKTFEQTIRRAIEWRPDRVALYSFAHLPRLMPNQRSIDAALLPSPETKLALFVRAMELFLEAGYAKIGMDHFAAPEDELARALKDRRLGRNFMGYTVRPTDAALGFGASAIGELHGNLMQNDKRLSRYFRALAGGSLPIERGVEATDDDRLRAAVIQGVMCNGFVDFAEVEARFGVDWARHFAAEMPELYRLEAEGFLRFDGARMILSDLGMLFVRNVAMVFDAYLQRRLAEGPRFSRTV
ncbi:MAG: Oxygen-independent coproporphyrinogen-III oxidase [candidate division BRC1 bacterium ADurb.BinA364]|nr:MAG: Oxygen-independent coproporphyrinogen-III oxidase [candidate division BRC1 bacterium ADurb.BinA364]